MTDPLGNWFSFSDEVLGRSLENFRDGCEVFKLRKLLWKFMVTAFLSMTVTSENLQEHTFKFMARGSTGIWVTLSGKTTTLRIGWITPGLSHRCLTRNAQIETARAASHPLMLPFVVLFASTVGIALVSVKLLTGIAWSIAPRLTALIFRHGWRCPSQACSSVVSFPWQSEQRSRHG